MKVGRVLYPDQKDPQEAHRRRGAPFTFWGEGFVSLLKTIRANGEAKAPSFDHRFLFSEPTNRTKDPMENDIPIEKKYVLFDQRSHLGIES